VFDIETHSADEMYRHDAASFFRLGGWCEFGKPEQVTITDDHAVMVAAVKAALIKSGHNIIAYDLPALGVTRDELMAMADNGEIIDTWPLAVLVDQPPESYVHPTSGKLVFPKKPEQYRRFYALDNLAFRYGVPGKSNDVRKLAEPYRQRDDGTFNCCGYGHIPTDLPEFVDYLRHDVRAGHHVLSKLVAGCPDGKLTDYHWREMRVAARLQVISMNRIRLDTDAAQAKVAENETKREQFVQHLHTKYDVPLVSDKGLPIKAVAATNAGKVAIMSALEQVGVSRYDLPKTKTGAPSLGGEGLRELADSRPDNTELRELVEAVAGLSGLRSVYQTALDHVHPDGFCHPSLDYLQRSGRVSTTNPGLTVFGKRGGRHRERYIFVPDVLPGETDYADDVHVMGAVDMSQVDARAVAVCSQDYGYMDLFGVGPDGKDIDAHAEVARAIWGNTPEYAADPASFRERGKPMHHANNYGIGVRKMAAMTGQPEAIAQQFKDGFSRAYPRVVEWQERVRAIGEQYGFIDNGWGRLMKVDRARAYTQAPALVGQGCARDMMMHGLLRLDPQVMKMIKAIVHDELVYSAPIRIARDVRQHIIDCLTFDWAPPYASRPIRVAADGSPFALTWGGCYDK
jgi:DNA polymerase-1